MQEQIDNGMTFIAMWNRRNQGSFRIALYENAANMIRSACSDICYAAPETSMSLSKSEGLHVCK